MITLIVVIVVVGFLMWLLTTYVPMAQPFKTILIAVVALVLFLWVLSVFGLIDLPAPTNLRLR